MAKKGPKKVFSFYLRARQGTQTHQNLTYAKDVDKMLYFVQNKSFHIIFLLIFWKNKFGKKFFILTCARKGIVGQFSTGQFGTGQFGTGQFGTKIIKADNLAPR